MNTLLRGLWNGMSLACLVLFSVATAQAQYTTPTINATLDAGGNEYGGANNTSGGFHVTWDANYLYVYKPDANESEAAVIYLDTDFLTPINGGTDANGNLTGYSYDNLSTVNLPMRADIVIYVKNSYREIRKSDGAGGWTLLSSGNDGLSGAGSDDYSNGDLSINDNGNGAGSDDRREFRVSWSHINGGIPPGFTWVAHMVSSGGYIYSPSPGTSNPTGDFSASDANFVRYLQIASTGNGSSTPFYSRECYTHIGGNIANFGAVDVFDFTMNTSGATITRDATSGGDWLIVGSLVVGNGATVDFGNGSTYGATDIWGNITIYDNSTVTMNSTTQPAQVGYDVSIHEPTGTFSLSNTTGGDVEIGRNFHNDGIFNCNERAVTLNGTGAQTVSGSSTIAIDYFIVNNTGSGVTLNREVSVDNKLDLIDGVVYTATASKLVMNDAAIVDGTNSGSDASHVSGPMDKTISATSEFTFPVGKSGFYRPVAITPTSTSTTTFEAEYMRLPPNGEGYDITRFATHPTEPLNNVLNVEYWLVDRTSGSANVYVKLFWDANSGVSDVTSLRVAHWDGSDWLNEGATAANGDTNDGDILSEEITSFSPFNFGEVPSPAPVALLYLEATPEQEGVALEWATATELDNAYFVVERSADGQHFEPIATIKGQGNASTLHRYTHTDNEPLRGVSYYRLKDVAFNGAVGYSSVVQVARQATELALKEVAGTLQLYGAEEAASIVIYDLQGRVVAAQHFEEGTQAVATHHLMPGIYIVQAIAGNGRIMQKFRVAE